MSAIVIILPVVTIERYGEEDWRKRVIEKAERPEPPSTFDDRPPRSRPCLAVDNEHTRTRRV